jgi:DNA-binding CsgD family transcriptional regulator
VSSQSFVPDQPWWSDNVELLRATRDFLSVQEGIRSRCDANRLEPGVSWLGRTIGEVRAKLQAMRPRSVDSLLPMVSSAVVKGSTEQDRRFIRDGVRIREIVNPDGLYEDAPQALSASPVLPYCRFAPVTVQLKLYDDGVVLIEGPRLGEERTALLVRRPDLVAAAKDLFGAALATSVPAAAAMADDPRPWLAPRQRDIIDLLAQDLHDDEVADQLGVSIRTVRGDIEVVRRLLGVRTRFAVGYRLGQLDGAVDLSESEAD